MEIQKIGPAYELIDSTYLQPRPSPFPNEAFLKLPGLSPIKSLPNLAKTKKYATRPRILEHHSILPREKKKVSLASASQLSKKKLLEAEVLVEDVQNPNLLHSLAKAFKKLDSAKKITLKLTSYGDLYLPAVRWLVWSLSRIKSLTSLTLYLPYHPNYKTNEYLQLLKPFTRNQNLQSFNLVIPIRYGIKSAVIHKVHGVLGRIKALKNVSVDLILSEYVYRVKPSILQRGLTPKLGSFDKEKQAFSVDVPYFVDRKEVVNLLSHVSLFNSLHSLKLNFSSFIHRIDGRIDDEVVNNIIPVLRNHKELVHLDLSFEMSWYLEENHIISLMKSISELSNLVCLKLNFSSCYGVTDQAIKETSKALYRLPNLELVSLNVSSCYQLTDSGVQFLIGGLARNKAIKRFELLIASCYKLTVKGIESLLLFENLKALSLNLENCSKMDEAATLCLAKVLTRLNCLETVNLNLSYLMKMTNYEFCALGKAISGLSELKYLSLEIGGYKTITESAFINFFRNLGVLKKLLGMVLNLRYNNQMTDRALSTLSIITCGFKQLKELKIDLVGADMLTEKCYPKLVKVFAMFEDSKNVEIFI